jgi:hypothetical protein
MPNSWTKLEKRNKSMPWYWCFLTLVNYTVKLEVSTNSNYFV